MGKKLLVVLGNGFTLDFLQHLDVQADIDVRNLFKHGAKVPWPASGYPGFLSFKYCPHLWNLGARPNMPAEDAMALIEDIITCINVYSLKPKKVRASLPPKPNEIYLSAYRELLLYLKYLFVFYNDQIEDNQINDNCTWVKFFRFISESDKYDHITIVTYNYDIWLERILRVNNIDYQIGLIGERVNGAKIVILKPHGSISFIHKNQLSIESFDIDHETDLRDCDICDLSESYENLDAHYLVSALIPPAGESSRINQTWAGKIRHGVKNAASELTAEDDLIVCGLSYWHVDRAELDEIFLSVDPSINLILINPAPERTLDAVLTSIFVNYTHYPSSTYLEGIAK